MDNNNSLRFSERKSWISWEGINKQVEINAVGPQPAYKRQLLHNVNGYALPGEMLALMGPSGSGKTTLLNILGGRALAGVSGTVLINGEQFSKYMKKTIAYVLQEDIFFDNITVREQLTFTSRLRLPDTIDASAKEDAVNRIVDMLNLGTCQNTLILLTSGGERKRCNIGTELLTNPSILLLDEPTSGLDSTIAAGLVGSLRDLAKMKMNVIVSIHQPSSRVFYAFDKLLLMADGHTMYYGPPQDCMKYLSTFHFVPPADYNPADFVMDLINSKDFGIHVLTEYSGDILEPNITGKSPKQILIKNWNSATVKGEILGLVNGIQYSNNNSILEFGVEVRQFSTELSLESESSDYAYAVPYSTQFIVLYGRAFKNSKANLFTKLTVFRTVSVSLIAGIMFFQMPNTEKRIPDQSGFIFFNMIHWFFTSMFSGLLVFLPERPVLAKERAAGTYQISAYFISRNISEIPIIVLLPTIFLVISYPMANMNHHVTSFIGVLGTNLLSTLCAESVGLFIGTCIEDFRYSLLVATLTAFLFILTGGFYVQVPPFMNWMNWVSPVSLTYKTSLQFQFTENVPCDGSNVIPACANQQFATPTQILQYFNVEPGTEVLGIGILLAFLLVFRIAAYVCIRFMPFNQGRK